MKIGKIIFEDGSMIQGWNSHDMSPTVRKQIATQLIDIAVHMLHGEFLEGDYEKEIWVKRKYRKRKFNKDF